MINVSTDAMAFSNAHFGAGIGSQFLNSVACTGSETMLTSCSSSSNIYCSNGHSDDAGVRCQGLFTLQTFHNTVMSLNIFLLSHLTLLVQII